MGINRGEHYDIAIRAIAVLAASYIMRQLNLDVMCI